MTTSSPFTDVMSAAEEIRAGRMIVVVDDEDRENEGDLTMAAEKITPEAVNFMAKLGEAKVRLPGALGLRRPWMAVWRQSPWRASPKRSGRLLLPLS